MPINIFGGITPKCNNRGDHSEDTKDFVTIYQVYDNEYLNKNVIKKYTIGSFPSYITLHNHRRIASIEPGIDANDAVNKKNKLKTMLLDEIVL